MSGCAVVVVGRVFAGHVYRIWKSAQKFYSETTGARHAATEGGAVLAQDAVQLRGVAHHRQRVEGAAARRRIRPLGLVARDARLHLELARAGGGALLVLALEAEADRVGGPLDAERGTWWASRTEAPSLSARARWPRRRWARTRSPSRRRVQVHAAQGRRRVANAKSASRRYPDCHHVYAVSRSYFRSAHFRSARVVSTNESPTRSPGGFHGSSSRSHSHTRCVELSASVPQP